MLLVAVNQLLLIVASSLHEQLIAVSAAVAQLATFDDDSGHLGEIGVSASVCAAVQCVNMLAAADRHEVHTSAVEHLERVVQGAMHHMHEFNRLCQRRSNMAALDERLAEQGLRRHPLFRYTPGDCCLLCAWRAWS